MAKPKTERPMTPQTGSNSSVNNTPMPGISQQQLQQQHQQQHRKAISPLEGLSE